jgi:16S rRNA (guanine527-N7)-methyltransferase
VNPDSTETLRTCLKANEKFFPRKFSEAEIELFCHYYQFVLKWNDRLHLTTLTSPIAFAERQIFESAFAARYLLPSMRQILDLGSGVGTPGVPLAILRPDMKVILVESSKKKAIFLLELVGELGIDNIRVLNCRFEELRQTERETCMTSRAIEKMNRMIPKILQIGQRGSQFLFFGNDELREIITRDLQPTWHISSFLIPASANRLLISLTRFT